jgi:protein AFG1
MWAAYKGFPACIDILLRFGADVHAADEMGFTALHWALVKGNYLCIQKLVEAGSDRFAKSKPIEGEAEGDTPSLTASKMKSDRQWRRALMESGYDEQGSPQAFPIPMVKDRRLFFKRFFFLWPFVLGGLQLHMLAYLSVWISVPGVLIVGYGLQYAVQKLLRWAPSDMNSMHKTPFLAGVFAGTLFWVAVRFVFKILPNSESVYRLSCWNRTDKSIAIYSNFFLCAAFATCACLTTYFYTITMTADPGFIPKGGSRGQTKKTIDDLVEHNAFNESHFCTTCMIRKPLRSKHCRRCGRCVAREDQ